MKNTTFDFILHTGWSLSVIVGIFIGVRDIGDRAWKKIFHVGLYIHIYNGLLIVSMFAYRGIILSLPGILTFSNLFDAILTLGFIFIIPVFSLMSIVKGESVFQRCMSIVFILCTSVFATLLVFEFLYRKFL